MYPEIQKLKNDFKNFKIKISKPIEFIRKDLFFIDLSINDRSWRILVDDEYQDFLKGNNLMNWYLVLNSLELYIETEDILEWSKELYIEEIENFLEYYKALAVTYKEIEKKLGKIDSYISSYDYEFRTGAIRALLETKI